MSNPNDQNYYYGQPGMSHQTSYGWGDANQDGVSFDMDTNFGQEQYAFNNFLKSNKSLLLYFLLDTFNHLTIHKLLPMQAQCQILPHHLGYTHRYLKVMNRHTLDLLKVHMGDSS